MKPLTNAHENGGIVAIDRTADLVDRIGSASRTSGPATFLALNLPSNFDPRRLLADPQRYGVVASYERPERGTALLAIGEAARLEVPAGMGPAAIRDEVRRVLDHPVEGDAPGLRARLLGGFRFDPNATTLEPWSPFGTGRLVLPRVLFAVAGEASGLVIAPGVEPGEAATIVAAALDAPEAPRATAPLAVEHPMSRQRWCDSVAQIADEVSRGLYEKAVLASMTVYRADGRIPIGRALARLRANYPDCHVFTFTAGDTTFLGASPELLVALEDGGVRALGLAGSTRRGETPEEDERLGSDLLSSGKERIEHETVVRAIRERLAPATDELHAPNQPRLRRLRNIQHLATEISGRARPGVDVLDLAQRLHPTPAVCGWPADLARAVIREHEAFDRGWYAGPVGWIDATGDGEFAVALRSAVVRRDHAWLFAGNGIMGDSVPESEYAEVQLKYRPLAEALGA